jgi:DMSO/TMAO reductase YedYZ heme-binding membrane subunit
MKLFAIACEEDLITKGDVLLEVLENVSQLTNENKVRHCVYIKRTCGIKCSILHIEHNCAYSLYKEVNFQGKILSTLLLVQNVYMVQEVDWIW